jgi:hypothetical protein
MGGGKGLVEIGSAFCGLRLMMSPTEEDSAPLIGRVFSVDVKR